MSADLSTLTREEYRALRATIAARGTMRLIVTVITFVAWAALALAVAALFVVPVFWLVPLLVLAAGFEVVFAAHVGVERVGRYLQARYERVTPPAPQWESLAMTLRLPAAGVDPLFSRLFVAAALVNLALLALSTADAGLPTIGPVSVEILLFAVFHAGFLVRVLVARRFASTQRERDLSAFSHAMQDRADG